MRAAVLLLLCGAALAGPKPRLQCVRTANEAREIARTRGKLIFLTVIVDNDAENRAVIDNVFYDRQFQKIAKEFVVVYANNDDEHGKVKVRGKGGKTEIRCRDCPSIRCLDHMTLAQDYARGFFPSSDARTPIHFVIDAHDEIVDTIMNGNFQQGFNHVPAKTVVARLKKVLDKHGRGLTEQEYETMVELLRDAKAARARGKVTLELEKLNQVLSMPKEVEGVKEAKKRIREIDGVAAKELQKLDDLIGRGEWEEALDALEAIEKKYPGTLSGAAAAKRRAELNDRKEVKRLLKARDLYEKGMQLLKRKKLDLAKKRFEKCVRLYAETKYGELAKQELAKFPTD